MLYKQNQSYELDEKLFKNPTSEYRAAPFWAWNCKLNKDILNEQIDIFKKMGFGGFHMHSRIGMSTPYLKDEFMVLLNSALKRQNKKICLHIFMTRTDGLQVPQADMLQKLISTVNVT